MSHADESRGGPGAETSSGTLTFLLTDLAGSTRLWEQFPDAMGQALGRHDAIIRAAVEGVGGQVVKSTGDGTMAVFTSAAAAVAASLEAQIGLTAEPWAATGPLRVRMGLHAGEAELRADDYFGPTVNRTARIMSAGHGGQVLLSASAAALALDRLPEKATLQDLGEHRLKDLGRPERVYQLVHPGLASTFPPLTVLDQEPGNLPVLSAAFVGRSVELAEVSMRLDDRSIRLLTLTGPGGTGKTSLAIRAAMGQATHFPDGRFFVDLAPARDANAVLVAIARVVGLGEVTDRPLFDELTERLRERRMLLLLDNFEQVTTAAGVATRLLGDCPELKLLVTSREALHVRAEHLYAVPPMTLPPAGMRRASAEQTGRYEAVQLFVERARIVRPDFRLTDENAAAVSEICLRLDGLPLAIELAAARLRLFSPEALRDRLGSRLGLLRSGARDLPERQQTLRATIEWSYQLLEPPEQRLLELLSVFSDADLVAVERVASDIGAVDGIELDALDGLASLHEKNLIRQVEVAQGEPRLVMLETIREYATERLDGREAFSALARRCHAFHFADFARGQRRELGGAGRDRAVQAMAVEVENLRTAWRYWVEEADLDQLNKLADSLLILNDARGWYLDTVVLTTDLLAVLGATASTPELRSQEIALRASLARALMTTKGYTPEVADAFARVLELFEEGGESRQHHSVLRSLASIYLLRTESDKAHRLGEEILALAEREDDPDMRIDGLLVVGSAKIFLNDLQGGLTHLDTAIASFATSPRRSGGLRVGNDPRVACLTTTGFVLWLTGYPDHAVERANAAVEMAAELGHPFTSAYAQFHSGLLHLWRREPGLVLERAALLLDIAEQHDFQIWRAVGMCLMGAGQTGLGRDAEGLSRIQSGMDLYQGMRTPPVFWPMLLFVSGGASHQAGRSSDGLRPVDAAIAMIGPDSGSVLLPELWLLRGDILAAIHDTWDRSAPTIEPEAEECYRRAYDLAASLGARMPQLRAATRLRRLSLARDDADPTVLTRGSLRAVLDTFTEGFETLDLREAREALTAH